MKLSIPQSCSENYQNFEPRPDGGFCQSCAKTVVDFSAMSDKEVMDYFKNRSEAKTCGRFRPDQLKAYASPNQRLESSLLKKPLIWGLSILSLGPIMAMGNGENNPRTEQRSTSDQDKENSQVSEPKKISGIIRDAETGEPIPFAIIYLKDQMVGTHSDFDGRFTFPQELSEGDTLEFQFLGYFKTRVVIGEADFIEVELQAEGHLIGEVVVDGPYQPKRNLWQKFKSILP